MIGNGRVFSGAVPWDSEEGVCPLSCSTLQCECCEISKIFMCCKRTYFYVTICSFTAFIFAAFQPKNCLYFSLLPSTSIQYPHIYSTIKQASKTDFSTLIHIHTLHCQHNHCKKITITSPLHLPTHPIFLLPTPTSTPIPTPAPIPIPYPNPHPSPTPPPNPQPYVPISRC